VSGSLGCGTSKAKNVEIEIGKGRSAKAGVKVGTRLVDTRELAIT